MYKRKSESGHTVEWKPDDEDVAKEAMEKVVGEINVEVDPETAEKIRERYRELIDSEDQ